jgi:hypothetical protein
MAPQWLTVIAWVSLIAGSLTAAAIAADVFIAGNHQRMGVMDLVWPITALYFGPLAWPAYARWGRPNSPAYERRTGRQPEYGARVSVGIGVAHCGAGCTLGDIVGESIVFALGATIAGMALPVEYIADFVTAFALGIAFQYFAIMPVREMTPREGIIAALKADTLSLTTFEVGLFGWMALMYFVFFPGRHLKPDHAAYWFLMQVGMVAGFITAYPANMWLIRRGIKEAM